MSRVIKSVEVINQSEEGPDHYCIGGSVEFNGPEIADIVEDNGTFFIFDKEDKLLAEIRNCPVVVTYEEEENHANHIQRTNP
ncbi:hypothetical protein [Halalkalibacter oceani]|uniref:hypothetical protein n=1 Tax=Halalkalibacter oceani TaxID=1653776 RepID=UPI003392A15D